MEGPKGFSLLALEMRCMRERAVKVCKQNNDWPSKGRL